MIQDLLRHSANISIYGVISVCLFVAVFVSTLIWALRLKRPYLNSMRELPLQEPGPAAPRKGETRDESA